MTKTKEITFEEALTQLEATVREMEAGDLGLDELLSKFETGIGLLRRCEAKLGEAQEKIEVLSQKAIAQPEPEPKPVESKEVNLPDSPPWGDNDEDSLF